MDGNFFEDVDEIDKRGYKQNKFIARSLRNKSLQI